MNFFQRLIVPLRDREQEYAAKIRQNMTYTERTQYDTLSIGREIATANQIDCAIIEADARARFEKSGERSPLSLKETERFWSKS